VVRSPAEAPLMERVGRRWPGVSAVALRAVPNVSVGGKASQHRVLASDVMLRRAALCSAP
jgi:hypothetical protein